MLRLSVETAPPFPDKPMGLINGLCSSSCWWEQIVPGNQWKFKWVTEKRSPNRHITQSFDVFLKACLYSHLINQDNEDAGCGGRRCVLEAGIAWKELNPLSNQPQRQTSNQRTNIWMELQHHVHRYRCWPHLIQNIWVTVEQNCLPICKN